MFSIDFLRRSPTGYRFKVKYDTGTSLRCYILSGTDTDSYFLIPISCTYLDSRKESVLYVP